MSPHFVHGDYVFCIRHRWQRFNVGDVVVVNHPELSIIIKRIARLREADASFLLSGDNPQSTSSEVMGWLPKSAFLGRVCYTVRRPDPSIS